MSLLLALAAAGADARLTTIDRRLDAAGRAIEVAEAPLVALLGRAERLVLAPPDAARRDALVRMGTLIRAVDRTTRVRVAALQAEKRNLATERARLVLTRLRREVGGASAGAIPLALPSCPTAVWRLPPGSSGVAPSLAARLERAPGLTLVTLPKMTIPAPASARIAYSGLFRRYRGTVILDHGHGWTTLVTGLDRLVVHTDGHVARGEPLGTSAAEVPLVGVQLSRRGRTVDPQLLTRRCIG